MTGGTTARGELMAEAIRLAVASVHGGGGGPFGAVIVKDGAIIARGTNQVTGTNDPTAHAEIVAIRSACAYLGAFHLRGSEMYTSCEPCPMCLAALYWAHLDAVYYACTRLDAAAAGFDDDFLYYEIERPPTQRMLPMRPMMREEGLAAFREWLEKPDRTPY